MKWFILTAALALLYSAHDLLFPAFHSDHNDSLTITFANIQPFLGANPSTNFSIITRYYFETPLGLNSVSTNLQPLFVLNEGLYEPTTQYIKDFANDTKKLVFDHTNYYFSYYFVNKNDIYTNDVFVCFDFTYMSSPSPDASKYDLDVRLYFLNYDSSFNSTAYSKVQAYSTAGLTLEDLSLALNVETSSGLQTKIYHVKLHRGTLSDALLSTSLWNNFYELYYQLLFYQEPSNCKLLYNRSKYTFAPAINGDFSESNNEMHSFFSTSLRRTHWVGYDSVRPGFVQLPKGLLGQIDSEFFELKLYVDFYILTESPAHFSAQQSQYNYPLLAVLDKLGNSVFSITHGYISSPFSPGTSYMHSFQFKTNAITKNKAVLEPEFYKTTNSMLLIRFHKTHQNMTRLIIYFGKTNTDHEWMFDHLISLPFDDFDQIILGKPKKGQSSSPIFAYFFNALHIFTGKYRLFYSSSQAFKAYHGLELVPYHAQTNPYLWFLPENPDELSAYKEALKSATDTSIIFRNLPCPTNCEICFDSVVCIVCRPFNDLNPSKECIPAHGFSHLFADLFGRNGIRMPYHITDKIPMTNIDTDSTGYSRMRLYYVLDKPIPALTATDEATCYIENDLGKPIYDTINWNFNNKSVSPYSEYRFSQENKQFQIKVKPETSLTTITKGTCEIKTFMAFYFNPTCESEYLSTPSLKGYLGLKFCTGVYVNVTDSPYMITPEASFTPGHYDYVIPVPGTSSFVYGKCKNNCKCWDGDLHTTKGYNSCFVNPSTGKICGDSFGLINYSLDKSRQACVEKAVIDAFKSCDLTCNMCDSAKTCTKCSQIAQNRNYLGLDFYGLYCGNCHADCLSCYGASSSDCWCSSTQFGPGNTRFDFEFNLCLPVANCGLDCIDCRSTGCFACRPDYYYDNTNSRCRHVMSKNCMFRNSLHDCIDCLPNEYLDSGTCRKCSSNCQVCFAAACSVCSDGFVLVENKCVSHYFVASARTVYQLGLPQDVHVSRIGIRQSFSEIRYQIHFIYIAPVGSYIGYDRFVNMANEPKTKFSTSLQYKHHLQSLEVLCSISSIASNSLLHFCDASTDSHAIATATSAVRADELCNKFLPGCARCISQQLCAECQQGYFLHTDRTQCLHLRAYLAERAVISPLFNTVKILQCVQGLHIDRKTGKCAKNIPNCLVMNDLRRCAKCVVNFTLNQSNTQCIKCLPNCSSCLFANACEKCALGYFILHHQSNNRFAF